MALEEVATAAGVPVPCIKLIAKWEGCLRKIGPNLYKAYLCPAKVPTIGMGTTVYNATGTPVRLSDPAITYEKAEELLAFDIGKKYAPAVRRAATFKTNNQYSACVSFAYNVGTAGFKNSTLCWLIKQGRHADATKEFHRWVRGGGRVLPGLVNRRKEEARLFSTPGEPYQERTVTDLLPSSTKPKKTDVKSSWLGKLLFWRE